MPSAAKPELSALNTLINTSCCAPFRCSEQRSMTPPPLPPPFLFKSLSGPDDISTSDSRHPCGVHILHPTLQLRNCLLSNDAFIFHVFILSFVFFFYCAYVPFLLSLLLLLLLPACVCLCARVCAADEGEVCCAVATRACGNSICRDSFLDSHNIKYTPVPVYSGAHRRAELSTQRMYGQTQSIHDASTLAHFQH